MPYGVVHDSLAFPANNMASSSTTAAFPSGRASSSSVTIALSSNNADDRRIIELLPGQVCKIGRSSKSEMKNMRASPNNALFDCAVVSRNHAELRAGREVSIIDRNSLHGTTVNGRRLNPGETFTLKTGDVIKLGDTVSRGPDTHDGVSLTFRRLDDIIARRRPSPIGYHAFQVKVPSETDISDIESDIESVLSVPNHRSSAKTTPEQPKMKLGTQESPINIDAAPTNSASVINLVNDDDDAAYEPRILSQMPNQPRIIPDSVDTGSHYPIPESAHAGIGLPIEARSDSGETVQRQNTSLSQILNDADDFEEQPMESDVNEDNFMYDQDDMDEDEDDLAGNPAMSGDDSEAEAEAEDEVESLFDTRHNRQLSAELGLTDQPVQEPTASKPRYDPVRSSQPPVDMAQNAATATQSPSKGPSTYTSRWDIPPAPPTGSSAFQGTSFGFTGQPGLVYPHEASPYPSLPGYSQSQPMSFGKIVGNSQPSPVNPSFGIFDAPEHEGFPFISAAADAEHESSISAQPSNIPVVKGKISIDDIVEPAQATASSAQGMMLDIEPMRPELNAEEPTMHPRGTSKRKADKMESGETTEPATKKAAAADASTSPRQTHRASRRRASRRSTARKIAVTAAQYAAGAAIGAVATMVFLTSDYAGELIQRLG